MYDNIDIELLKDLELDFLSDSQGIYGIAFQPLTNDPNVPPPYVIRPDCIYPTESFPRLPMAFTTIDGSNSYSRCVEGRYYSFLLHLLAFQTNTEIDGSVIESPDRYITYDSDADPLKRLKRTATDKINMMFGRLFEEAAPKSVLDICRQYPSSSRSSLYQAAVGSFRTTQLMQSFPVLAHVL